MPICPNCGEEKYGGFEDGGIEYELVWFKCDCMEEEDNAVS